MEKEITNELKKRCKNIYSGLSNLILWKWDEKYNLALSEVRKEYAEKVLSIIAKEFDLRCDSESMSNAPEEIKTIATALGGIRENQLFFSTFINAEVVLFCTWWPWKNDKNISIRVGVKCPNKPIVNEIEMIINLETWFEM